MQVLGVVCVMAMQGPRTTGAQAVVWTTVVTLVLSKKLTESFTIAITADLVFAFASFLKSELEMPADLLKKFEMGQTNYFAQKKKTSSSLLIPLVYLYNLLFSQK